MFHVGKDAPTWGTRSVVGHNANVGLSPLLLRCRAHLLLLFQFLHGDFSVDIFHGGFSFLSGFQIHLFVTFSIP